MNTLRLKGIINQFAGRRVGVAGDLMLDVYLWGKASRISPEAPVPVLQVKDRTQCLGGAANVMRNVVTLGGGAAAFGVVGADANGEQLRRMLEEYGISAAGVEIEEGRRTTEKQRVIAASQQLLRIDFEDTGAVSSGCRERMEAGMLRMIADGGLDAVIFEDYAKGLLEQGMVQRITDAARGAGIITALDPNPKHPMRIVGLSVMKPNRQEAYAMAGRVMHDDSIAPEEDDSLREVAEILLESWRPECLLITLASQGMALFDRNGRLKVIPTKAREVYDVSGAGDTVVSAFTLALAVGASPEDAAEIANHAAGVVVGKVGTAPVGRDELLESLKNGD
jgi:D-beta-D-heptose 7-phosphate kinase/D-beta-D-heptose 1-phosphate adenosyltransferase